MKSYVTVTLVLSQCNNFTPEIKIPLTLFLKKSIKCPHLEVLHSTVFTHIANLDIWYECLLVSLIKLCDLSHIACGAGGEVPTMTQFSILFGAKGEEMPTLCDRSTVIITTSNLHV